MHLLVNIVCLDYNRSRYLLWLQVELYFKKKVLTFSIRKIIATIFL